MTAKWTVFLDRDGVFNPEPLLLRRNPGKYEFLPGAKEAFARLNRPDIQTCLCTNQPFTVPLLNIRGLARVHAHLKEELRQAGGHLDRIEASWAPPFSWHRRRKPKPGMLQDGGKALAADPARSFMVGDKVRDAQAAVAYGATPILVSTSRTEPELQRGLRRAGLEAEIVADLAAAVDSILKQIAARIRNG